MSFFNFFFILVLFFYNNFFFNWFDWSRTIISSCLSSCGFSSYFSCLSLLKFSCEILIRIFINWRSSITFSRIKSICFKTCFVNTQINISTMNIKFFIKLFFEFVNVVIFRKDSCHTHWITGNIIRIDWIFFFSAFHNLLLLLLYKIYKFKKIFIITDVEFFKLSNAIVITNISTISFPILFISKFSAII